MAGMSGPSVVAGQTLGHYRILEQIGAGGMGVVFRAHDERLDRDVALKILPSGALADESARKRFRKEALALSRLNHPNIATVFDFDSQSGTDFLVTELVGGACLDVRLLSGPLPEKEVVRLGIQLAEGLAAAHAQGVVHRDLKPGNVRLTAEGRLKILDFGLAKVMRPAEEGAATASLSEVQGPAGTLPYMAPEQLLGEAVDARTDLWAAGLLLYEMATGRRPFEAKSSAGLTDEILHAAPAAPRQAQGKLSPRLEEIILKCLEKEPERRYQSAKELAVDLQRLRTPSLAVPVRPAGWARRRRWVLAAGATAAVLVAVVLGLNPGGTRQRLWGGGQPTIRSIAVLPLQNLSGDPKQDYFADGMTEELTTELAQLGQWKVISNTSVQQYKEAHKSLPEIARELNVDGVLEGSVQRSGGHVRVTAQLIRARTDEHLWARSYDRDLKDVLTLESDLAREIAGEVNLKLTGEQRRRLGRERSVRPEAYEAYLQGLNTLRLRQALASFQKATEIDPNYAPAYAAQANTYFWMAYFGTLSPAEAFPKAKAAAQKALELDDSLPEAHAALGSVYLHHEWNFAEAEKEYRRALDLNPNDADVHHLYAHFLLAMNRPEDSVTESQRAMELDPVDPTLISCVGWHSLYAGMPDRAIEMSLRALQMDPDDFWAHFYIGWAYEQKGRYKEAVASQKKAVEASGGIPFALAALARAYALAGQRGEAERVLAQLLERSRKGYVSAYEIASVYAGLGDKEKTFEWLQKAYEERSSLLIHLSWDTRFKAYRSDPRFQQLAARIGLPARRGVTSVAAGGE